METLSRAILLYFFKIWKHPYIAMFPHFEESTTNKTWANYVETSLYSDVPHFEENTTKTALAKMWKHLSIVMFPHFEEMVQI